MNVEPGRDIPRIRIRHLHDFRRQGRRFSMLTSYDQLSAAAFERAGIEVLLVGDSVGTVVLGHPSTVHTRHEDIVLFTGAVARSVTRPLIVSDLAFGSYQASVEDALRHGTELLRAGAHAVKLEGGQRVVPQVSALVEAGIPVMGHLGFTPQSEHALGGFRVQGREQSEADRLAEDALALQDAGAFAIVLELVPASVAARVTEVVDIPTIGIGAGPDCNGQVLVWQDMAGMSGFSGRFVKQFAQLGHDLERAAAEYHREVAQGEFPTAEHSFE
ncbi:3-methyl-2-oxobutanoate hydroxymethyltransferase [Devriesea agamarum]|uniref:3-methyl-2-oxobutanoate hydroxymethyltransferase n=1 Tax=Devriesea agamarum TaxID=472569 RepID=UPI00071DF568|nr:3-methyl-2-oxobutanoate hydroxymethyltransferase [Devriesea agamarum]